MWSGVAAGDFSATQIRAGVDQNILADYLFRNQKLPDGWGFGMTFQSGAGIGVRAEAPIGVTTGVGPDDGTLWKIAVSMGAVSFGFGLGHQKAKHGFNFRYVTGDRALIAARPSPVGARSPRAAPLAACVPTALQALTSPRWLLARVRYCGASCFGIYAGDVGL
jgi:hypothetical protein